VLATVRGITDLAVFTSLGQPTIQIDIDRARAARYGLTAGRHQRPSAWRSAAMPPAICFEPAATGSPDRMRLDATSEAPRRSRT